jgi:ferredoxin-NADP reductase
MAALVFEEMAWNEGEKQMHKLTKNAHVSTMGNPTVPSLSQRAASMLESFPLLAVGTIDDEEGDVWTTLWGGDPGFARGLPDNLIAMKVPASFEYDPVVQVLAGKSKGSYGMIDGLQGKMVSGLSIDLMTRKRVKLFGRAMAGALAPYQEDDSKEGVAMVQLIVKIEQSLGNCPKYLNSKRVYPHISSPSPEPPSGTLSDAAVELIKQADLFFVSSANGKKDMDTNHRGGPKGFVRLIQSNGTSEIVWPEYSGNLLYQTLGNFILYPKAGLVFPNFETGDVLYVTGTTDVLIGDRADALIPRSNLAVKLIVKKSILVREGLQVRAEAKENSPYNPRVRPLAAESMFAIPESQENLQTAKLIQRQNITSDIAKLTFTIAGGGGGQTPKPGQWVALDLSKQLYEGYSHMRDEDPTSINDDHIRTFTVSSSPPRKTSETPADFSITFRKVGRVTSYLFDERRSTELEVRIRGFGGEFEVKDAEDGGETAFIAGGIGVTPLLASLSSLNILRLRLFWTLQVKDLGLVKHVFEICPELAAKTSLYITGKLDGEAGAETTLQELADTGANCVERRLQKEDLEIELSQWYMCASAGLSKAIQAWYPSRDIVFEDFSY